MSDKDNDSEDSIKGSAFGICFMRCVLSMLPSEAGAICYDDNTPDFEGVALDFHPSPDDSFFGTENLMTAAKLAKDFAKFRSNINKKMGDKDWGGFDFNVCRAHFVEKLLLESVQETSPIRQIVFCGVGQDYRGMRHGKAIKDHGAKVFELDLGPMMTLRKTIKEEICEMNEEVSDELPETHELSIDFSVQHVSEVLLACPAFDVAVPTLYLWEGVSYYLAPEAMASFLTNLADLMRRAPATEQQHHRLFFDHLIDIPKLATEEKDVPAQAMLDVFNKEVKEPLMSFLDFDQVEPYLKELKFSVQKQVAPPEMYTLYQAESIDSAYHLKESKYFGMVVAKPFLE